MAGSILQSPMTIFQSRVRSFVPPPDNLTIPQFFVEHRLPSDATESPCLIEEKTGRKIYLDEICSRTNYLARALKETWNIGNGDIVALCCPNHIDYIVCVWATHKLGAILASMSPNLTKEELVYHIKIAEPKVLFVHLDNYTIAKVAALDLEFPTSNIVVIDALESNTISLDGLISRGSTFPEFQECIFSPGEAKTRAAFLTFSSGTTGAPKAVSISHYNVICNVLQSATHHGVLDMSIPEKGRRFRPGDVFSGVLPFYHIYGMVTSLHFSIYARMSSLITPKFDFQEFLDGIARYHVTHLMIVPPQAVLLSKHPAAKKADLSSVRFCMVAAAPMTAELAQQLLKVMPGISLGQGYGMTETCAAVSIIPAEQQIGTLGSGGQLVPGTLAKMVKPDGSLARVGESGELFVKGGQVALGYYKNPEATNETFVDGWIRTGDEVTIDSNGDLFILDRIKEILKVKGHQVAPAELEGHLLDHPDIADAGVVGTADEFSGELPVAFAVLKSPLLERVQKDPRLAVEMRSKIFKHVADVKSKYKWLTGGIYFIDAVPKSPSGKILRRVLREHTRKLAQVQAKL